MSLQRYNRGMRALSIVWLWCVVITTGTIVHGQSQPLLSAARVNGTILTLTDLPNSVDDNQGGNLAPSTSSPDPSTNFSAILDNFTAIPPDVTAAAGTNYLMVAHNSEILIQDKSGTPVFQTSLSNFWSTQVGANGRVLSPKIVYDHNSDRWIFTACANPQTAASSLLIGVTAGSDPTGAWFQYSVAIDTTNRLWGEVGGLGFNNDWIVVTKNLRFVSGNAFSRSRVYVFDRAVLEGTVPVGNISATNVLLGVEEDFTVSSLIPAVSRDDLANEMYLVSNGQGDDGLGNGSIRLFRLTATTNLVFSLNQFAQPVGGAPWSDFPTAGVGDFLPQRDSPTLISAGDSRIQNLVYQGGTLWCAQTVFLPSSNPTRSAAQWWQLSTSGTVIQFGRVEDPNNVRYYAYPSIAVNRNGDALIGYSSFSGTQYPSASYSFRFATDPANSMRSEIVYKAGEAPYTKLDSIIGQNLWGRYSATVLDPLNNLDLWTVQEYAALPVANIDRWGTWWGKVLLSVPPDNNLEVVVTPPSGSLIPAGSAQTFSAKVFDTIPVTNAVVSATAPGFFTNLTFLNNGGAPDLQAGDNVYTRAINLPSTNTIISNIISISAPGKNPLVLTNIYTVAPPPGNDFFANAQKIPDRLPETNGFVIGRNFFASTEPNEPVHANVPAFGNSVWWNWAPVSSGPVVIDTLGSQFNTVLAVYTNSSIATLAEVISSNDVTNQFGQFVRDKAFVTFQATAGVTYRVAVAGATTNDFGNIRLRMAFNGAPDEVKPVVSITNMVSGTQSVTNPPSGLIVNTSTITLSGSATDPAPNNSDVGLVQVVGNDGIPITAIGTNNWTITANLQSGSNLLQVVAFDVAQNQSVPVSFAVTLRAFDPVNDIFANAVALTNNNGSVTVNNVNATFEGNEPRHAGKIGGKSIWYSFTPTQSGVLNLSTTNSTIDTLMALYTGERINELVPVAANDDAHQAVVHSEIRSGVIAGRKYTIAVDGLAGAAGTIVLHHSFAAESVFTATVTNTVGGFVLPGSGTYASNALVSIHANTNSGFNFVTWIGDIVSLDNPLQFNIRSNLSVTAVFGRRQISDDFESGAFKSGIGWTSTGSTGWVVEAASAQITNTVFGGTYFARSGVTANNQNNSLSITRRMRADRARFSYKVSSESLGDKLEFYLNGTNLLSESGVTDWREFSFDVPAGTNTVSWVYAKDFNHVGNLDSVFIDNVDLPLREQVDTNINVLLNTNAVGFVNGKFQIRVEGQTNQVYRVQRSVDLANWITIATNYAPFGLLQYTDVSSSSNQTIRFYRVRSD